MSIKRTLPGSILKAIGIMTSRCTKTKKQNLVINQKAEVGRIIKHDYVRLHTVL